MAAVRAPPRRARGDPRARGSGGSRTARGSPSARRPRPSRSPGHAAEASRWRSASGGSRPGGATSTRSGRSERLGLEPEGVLRIGLTHYNTAAEVDRLARGAARRSRRARRLRRDGRRTAPDVAIIGGGIVGTALAAELAGRGAQVTLYERADGRGRRLGAQLGRRLVSRRPRPRRRSIASRSRATGRSPTSSPRSCRSTRQSATSASAPSRRGSSRSAPTTTRCGLRPPRSPATTRTSGPTFVDRLPCGALEPGLADGLAAVRLDIGFPVAPASATPRVRRRSRSGVARRSASESTPGRALGRPGDRRHHVGWPRRGRRGCRHRRAVVARARRPDRRAGARSSRSGA